MIPEGLYLDDLGTGSGCFIRLAKEKVLLNSMKGIGTLSRVDVLCPDKTGTIRARYGSDRDSPVKDTQDLEALTQYVKASMDQNDTMDYNRKNFIRHQSASLGRLKFWPLTSKKESMEPLPLKIWDLCIRGTEFV